MTTTPAVAAASRTSRASDASPADGSSVSTCLPARIAARFHGAWSPFTSDRDEAVTGRPGRSADRPAGDPRRAENTYPQGFHGFSRRRTNCRL
jgi:hypothetical protein